MVDSRRIAIITGSRAEYGLLLPLIRLLAEDSRTEPVVIATGSHLSPAHGMTVTEIEADGVAVAEKVDILSGEPDSGLGMARSMGRAGIGLAEALDRQRPDLVVVFGDRTEMLAAAQAAMALRLPIAHIAGGQLTEGAVDDAIRHAITKMAHLHFTAVAPYGRRILQLGEAPDRVFVVGSTGLDTILAQPRLDQHALEKRLGLSLGQSPLLVTFHPETLAEAAPETQVDALLAALAERLDHHALVMTLPNADAGGRAIARRMADFAAARPDRVVAVPSLGSQGYLSMMALCAAVVGNSSSGIIEAPSFRVPTVNIGDRQKGRLRAASIIDCPCETPAIKAALSRALSPDFRASLSDLVNPFGDGQASRRIAEILASHPLDHLLRKSFVDLP